MTKDNSATPKVCRGALGEPCGVELIVGVNWTAGRAKSYNYLCSSCSSKYHRARRNSPTTRNRMLELRRKQNARYRRNPAYRAKQAKLFAAWYENNKARCARRAAKNYAERADDYRDRLSKRAWDVIVEALSCSIEGQRRLVDIMWQTWPAIIWHGHVDTIISMVEEGRLYIRRDVPECYHAQLQKLDKERRHGPKNPKKGNSR